MQAFVHLRETDEIRKTTACSSSKLANQILLRYVTCMLTTVHAAYAVAIRPLNARCWQQNQRHSGCFYLVTAAIRFGQALAPAFD